MSKRTLKAVDVYLEHHNASRLNAYRSMKSDLREHSGIEQAVLAGGYGYRQVMEMIQNGADAVLEAYESDHDQTEEGRIFVMLRNEYLYAANTGAPLGEAGLKALLSSHSSPKRGNQIGRFGIGFKSLLRLGGKIDIFTKSSGNIRFDPERCMEVLRNEFDEPDVPRLRMAWPLNDSERKNDTNMDQISWAETIVRSEICDPDFTDRLRENIDGFPPEFLLFLPVTVSLELDDGNEPTRKICVESDDTERILSVGDTSSNWIVVTREISITDKTALSDATHIHARGDVPVSWAIPMERKREDSGRFWAFFPTQTPTHLPGILNAPWKLNSDRNAIISGEWNSALMKEAAALIAGHIPNLHLVDDPGRTLDFFPRRLERKDEDASTLIEALWSSLEKAIVIPDATGNLRRARDLWRHPHENTEIANMWMDLASSDVSKQLVHPSCMERQRYGRLTHLAGRIESDDNDETLDPNLRKYDVHRWFSDVADTDPGIASDVLKLAEAYENDCTSLEWREVRKLLKIIPVEGGQLMTSDQVVFAPEGTSVPDGRYPVVQALCDNKETYRILSDVMHVRPLTDDVWISVLQEALPRPNHRSGPSDEAWTRFWSLLRSAPETPRLEFISREPRDSILVRRRDGKWCAGDAVLMPGELLDGSDETTNANVLVDDQFHEGEDELLKAIGIVEVPSGPESVYFGEMHRLFDDWLFHWRSHYSNEKSSRASWGYLCPVGAKLPRGFGLLCELSGLPNAKLTSVILGQIAQGIYPEQLKFGHQTVNSYPQIDVSHPLLWFILKHGEILIGDDTVRLSALLHRQDVVLENWIQGREWLLPALDILAHSVPIVIPSDIEIINMWLSLINALSESDSLDYDCLASVCASAAQDGVVPESMRFKTGKIPLNQIFVTGSADLAKYALRACYAAIALDDVARELWISKGARDLSELLRPEFSGQTGPVELLASSYPEITDVLLVQYKDTAQCLPVSNLILSIGDHESPIPCLMRDDILHADMDQLSKLSRSDRFGCIIDEIATAGWLDRDPKEAIDYLGNSFVDDLREKVSAGNSMGERVLRAVGGRREPLLETLGELSSMDFIRECSALQLAELTLAHHGLATLMQLRGTLEEEGLNPPTRWGTASARSFVSAIGFPEDYASSPESRRESEEIVSGPIALPPLHDFQDEVFAGVETLVASGTDRRRAVVNLPTGAGKTRVMVEAAVKLVLNSADIRRIVVWIAQTDELCEQAVQAFRQVWINLGTRDTDLRIIRLWGGNPSPAIQELDRPVVVVASIQTLNSRMGSTGLKWLSKPGLVVVDECHHGITPSYTNLLRWLDAAGQRSAKPGNDEPPILGLSATPFRADNKETRRLASRFDGRWFPADQEGLIGKLRRQGVLAQIDNQALESGVGLLPEETEGLAKLPEEWEGLEFENLLESINRRLAGCEERNQLLVNRMVMSKEHSILFFANSVLHAEEISARLNLAGITSAVVSGTTPRVARRSFLERFRSGDIRVLCNHSVLSVGFDAPKTDMILISRQVFSPVRYMQMVGRGLRGVKNGGKKQCNIVTVMDNLGRFKDRHPYHFCREYYTAN